MRDREYSCSCVDFYGKRTSEYNCNFCDDKINAEECIVQFFEDQDQYEVTTLTELEDRIQKLTNEVVNLKQHLKLLIMDSK